MKKNLFWLASYPKSGNTWTRIFLANYLINADKPVPINQVHRFGTGDTITKMYELVAGRPIDPMDMGLSLKLRDKVLRGIAANNADVNFVKTHNIRAAAYGVTLIPDMYSRAAIYIVRNPLDTLLSYARHFGMTHEDTAVAMASSENGNSGDEKTVWTFLGSWSEHVESWTSSKKFPVLAVRYEDLLAKPHQNFHLMLQHIGMPVDEDRLDKAVRFSSFDEVSKQEEDAGFVESSPHSQKFFSKGTQAQWKSDLAPELIQKVRQDHHAVMKKFGYLDD